MNELYCKSGGELADRITEKQLEMIVRMVAEYQRKGFDEDAARRLAVRVGMRIILDTDNVELTLF